MAPKDKSKVATQVRFNEETYKLLSRIAEEECRSINAQIEYFAKKGIEDYLQQYPYFNQRDWSDTEF